MSRPAVALVLLALLVGACGGEPAPTAPFTAAERAALEPGAAGSLPLHLRVPGDGAVVPWTFPTLEVRWDDAFQADAFHVRVRDARGVTLADAYTTARGCSFAGAEWQAVRRAVGEGGAFDVVLVAASVGPDGRPVRGPSTRTARVRFSAAGEHPSGHVYYALKQRYPGAVPGPLTYDRRLMVPMRVAMDGTVEPFDRRLFDSDLWEPGEPAAPGWKPPPPEPVASRSYDFSDLPSSPYHVLSYGYKIVEKRTPCAGCHTTSGDGRYAAVVDYSNFGALSVVRLADRR